jgi:hypothetical protein
MFDLHTLLPGNALSSRASGILQTPSDLYVYGEATFPSSKHGMIWHAAIAEPISVFSMAGGLLALSLGRRKT